VLDDLDLSAGDLSAGELSGRGLATGTSSPPLSLSSTPTLVSLSLSPPLAKPFSSSS